MGEFLSTFDLIKKSKVIIEHEISKVVKSSKCIATKSVVIPKSFKNPSLTAFRPVFISMLMPID